MKKTALIIRVITLPPFCALTLIIALYLFCNNSYKNTVHLILSCLFLAVFPLLAYPLSIFYKKEKRRKSQRNLAIILSVLGYIFGTAVAFIGNAPNTEKRMFLTYLISGIIVALTSVIGIKSSGHTCGLSGPVTMLAHTVNPLFGLGYILLVPVFWASVNKKRHTVPELIIGTVIPIITYGILAFFI